MNEQILTVIAVMLVGGELTAVYQIVMDKIKTRRGAREKLDAKLRDGQQLIDSNVERLESLERQLELADLNYRSLDREAQRYECRLLNIDQTQTRRAAFMVETDETSGYSRQG